MKRGIKLSLGIVAAGILLPVIVMGYLGFVPGLSEAMGATTPRDLGVSYSDKELALASEKIAAQVQASEKADANSRKVDLTLSEDQLNAMANQKDKRWKDNAFSNVQVKVSQDGEVEASGKLDAAVLAQFAERSSVNPEYVNQLNKLVMIERNARFYIKGTLSIENGNVEGEVTELEVGRLRISNEWISSHNEVIESMVEGFIAQAGLDIESAQFNDGSLHFKGTVKNSAGFGK